MSRVSRPLRFLLAAVAGSVMTAGLISPARASALELRAPINLSHNDGPSVLPTIAVEREGKTKGAFRVLWHDFTVRPAFVGAAVYDGRRWVRGAQGERWRADSMSPQAVTDLHGDTHVVWSEKVEARSQVFYSTWDGHGWSEARNLSRSAGEARNPTLSVTGKGEIFVAWEDNREGEVRFFEAHRDAGRWSDARDTGLRFREAAFLNAIRLASSRSGTLHAVWYDGADSLTEVFHAERALDGTWSVPESVSRTPTSRSSDPAIAVGGDGTVHVVWNEQEPVLGMSFDVFYACRAPDMTRWSEPLNVSRQKANTLAPAIAVGPRDDGPRIAWTLERRGREIYYAPTPGAEPVNVSRSPSQRSDRVALDLDAEDDVYFAWEELVGANREIYFTTTRDSGDLSPPPPGADDPATR